MMFRRLLSLVFLLAIARVPGVFAQTPPPAPVLAAPANGASVVQPVLLQWQPIVDPDGPIGSYSWQVSPTSTFATVVASGFNNLGRPDIPLSTQAQVSGLANGSYFWRVKGAQDLGGATGFVDSPWSTPRSFTVTGLGPAPAGVPSITSPAFNSSFHPFETFDIVWTAVTGAHYYILEADDDAGFSHPLTLSGGPTIVFGTRFHAGWGNEIPNVHYRVRAVSADNVWGRPSATLTVHITNTAPVPPPPTPLSPSGGVSVSLPFTFDWTDTANPQVPGYDIDVDDEPNFQGAFGVLMVQQISRSDYMLAEGLPPGRYFWRVRALHGNVIGPWSAGVAFTVTAAPATPPGLQPFWVRTDPGTAYGGNSTAARIALNGPAPSGGALVRLASDFPNVEIPNSVVIPAGSTDAIVEPVTTPPMWGPSVGTIRAAYGGAWVQSSIGAFPILWGASLNAETATGGTAVTGTLSLLGPAPPGGLDVTLISSNPALARPPATVSFPQGATNVSFSIATSPVAVPTQIVFSFGTALEGFRSPDTWLVLTPAGAPAPPPAVSTITLNPAVVRGGGSGTGTVTLSSPAPSGGALIRLQGSMEGDVIVPNSVTVPAGSMTADFPITPPPVVRPHWVLIQASYGFDGALHAMTLRVDPGPPSASALYAIGVSPFNLIAGQSALGTVGLSIPAPPGGEVVALASSDPSVAQVPSSVVIAEGNSTASFTVTTNASTSGASVSVTGTAGGASKTAFLNIGPDPNAPLSLVSITPSVSGAVGGNSINTTIFLNKAAPAGGAVVSLSSSNTAAARVPATVTVQAGLGFATFNITTSPVAVDTPVTITGTLGVTRTAVITVMAPPSALASIALNPSSVTGGSASTGTVALSAAAPAGGTTVTLSSSNPAVAAVPANVVIAAGATSATFQLTTTAVASTTTVTISGSAGGSTRSATLTVNPNAAGFRGPLAQAADTGGDGNGFEVSAINALSLDGTVATDTNGGTASSTSCTSTGRDRHRFLNYGFGVGAGTSVLGIEVRLDARVDGVVGAPAICVQLSWNGGASWTVSQVTPTLSTTTSAYILGGPANTWGRTWTAAELSEANFRVRLINVANSTARDFSLDWVGVRVTTGGTSTPDTTPPTVALTSPAGGAVSGTVTLSASASDNVAVTRVEFLVDGAVINTDTTSPYSVSWNTTGVADGPHTLTARAFDAAGNQATSNAISVNVNNGAVTPPVLDLALSGVPASISRGQTFTAAGAVANTGGSAAPGYTVQITFTPSDSMRLQSPQSNSQGLAPVPSGGSQSVSWQIRADRSGSATVTMSLRNAAGTTVDTASKAITITN